MSSMNTSELTAAVGTMITDLDPTQALEDEQTRTQLRHLFDTRSVLVFRGLDIDERTHANLVRMLIGMAPLGDDEPASSRPGGVPFYVSNKEPNGGAPFGRLLFHSDMMWSEHTFKVLSLYAVEVEPGAAGTIFASGVDAWKTLPEELRKKVEGLNVIQSHVEQKRAGGDPDVLVPTFEGVAERSTPVALTHPRTGEIVLYVSQQMTSEIEGLPEDESEELLQQLFDHLYRPEAIYEHEWNNGDLVAFDNIAIQHARPNVVLDGPTRTLRKIFAPKPPRSANPSSPSFAKAG